MSCPASAPAPLRCPTLPESIDATYALLPRGRAWGANSRSVLARFLSWLGALTGTPAAAAWPAAFVQAGWFAALGAVRNFFETRLCALRLEFWCATMSETRPEWMLEYGLPDDCDPYPDLCEKIKALGGRRCELYQALVARLGWVIDCVEFWGCPDGARADCAYADNIVVDGGQANRIEIVVDLGLSTAYGGGTQTPFLADNILADRPMSCEPDIAPLQCLIDRIAPAHVVISYATVGP